MKNDFIGKILCNKKTSNESINIEKNKYVFKTEDIDIYLDNNNIFKIDNFIILLVGEIDNSLELKELLNDKEIDNNNYSELIINGFKKYNTKFFEKINGSYAFCLYDYLKNELYLVRDKLGTKNIYYNITNNKLCFGTDLKVLIKKFKIEKEINNNALESYLSFQYSPLDETMYKNINKILPGHFLKYNNGKIEIKKYYELIFQEDNSKKINEYAEEIHNIASKTIKEYEDNSKSITAFLSSGVDSSYITSLSNKSTETYTINFKGLKDKEADYAKKLSKKLNKKNNTLEIDPKKYFDAIKEISSFISEPLADPSSIGMYLLCKEASKKYKTALIGEGPDEFFAGYNVYQEPLQMPIYNKIPFCIRRIIGKICECLPQVRGINFLVRRGKKVEDWYIGNANIFSYKERKSILKNKSNALKPNEVTKKYYDIVKDKDSITKMQYIDMNLWLVGDELFNAEMMGKHNNLKLKAPFLNQELIDLAMKVPTEYRINKENTKIVFRDAASNTLEDTWTKKKKLGFPTPLKEWLKIDKYYNMIKKEFNSEEATLFFKTDKILNLLEEHFEGKKDNSRKIWTIYVYILWYQNNFGGNK